MSKIKVKISETKFLSFYKTLVQVVKLLEEFEGAKKQNNSISDEQNELSRNKDQQKIQGDVNEQDVYGWSNLHWSTFFGKYAQCQDLLSAGADVNLPDEHGFTPLFVAARRGNFEISKLLLDSGAIDNALLSYFNSTKCGEKYLYTFIHVQYKPKFTKICPTLYLRKICPIHTSNLISH